MKAHSLDLRQRVVAAYEHGTQSIAQVAEQFNVGATFIKKMLRQKRAHGSLTPLAQGQAEVLWLSPYSPDFSPIELLWSKIKSSLRKAKARAIAELAAALNKGLELITLDDCRAWFKHCGYLVAPD
jgi:transposase